MVFDVARVRGLYVSLSDGWTYLNAGERAQVPERVSSAVSRAFRTAPLQAHTEMSSGSHSRAQVPGGAVGAQITASARLAVADLVGGRPDGVVLGPNRAVLLHTLSTAMSRQLRMGREVVLSRVDDPANTAPWLMACDLYGAHVRWAEADLSTGTLPEWQYGDLVTPDTALVAVAAANAHVGTVTDVAAVAREVHRRSRGWVVVDATAYAPYRVIDIDAWEADVVAVDLAPLGGPEIGALVFRDPTLPAQLKLMDAARGRHATVDVEAEAERRLRALEVGGHAPGLLGGVPAAVDHLANLDDAASGTRRRRLEESLPKAESYMHVLAQHLVHGLQSLRGVHVVGLDGEFDEPFSYDSVERIPRVSFMVAGLDAATVGRRLVANNVIAQVVPLEDSALLDQMGVAEQGGAVCVAMSPHNTAYDVDHLVRVVAGLV